MERRKSKDTSRSRSRSGRSRPVKQPDSRRSSLTLPDPFNVKAPLLHVQIKVLTLRALSITHITTLSTLIRARQAPSTRNTFCSDPRARQEADRALDIQYPSMGDPTGERISTRRATLAPYKNLPPDLKMRAGERSSRTYLTLPEHICGLPNMATKDLPQGTEVHGSIEHAAQVAQDTNWHDPVFI